MKKILTRREKEKAEKKRNLIVGIIVIGLLLVSTIGYAFFSSTSQSSASQRKKYNNINFYLMEDGRWYFVLEGSEFATYFTPEEVKNISIEGDFSLNDFSNLPLYLHFENNKQIESEILINLNRFLQRTNYFCFPNEECSWVEKNCSNDNMLIIKEAEVSLIKKENKCIYLFYNETEDLKVADSFIFKTLKII